MSAPIPNSPIINFQPTNMSRFEAYCCFKNIKDEDVIPFSARINDLELWNKLSDIHQTTTTKINNAWIVTARASVSHIKKIEKSSFVISLEFGNKIGLA